jgi:hypothetical protein
VEAVAGVSGFGETDDGFGGEGILVAEAQPIVRRICVATLGETGAAGIAYIEQVAEDLDAGALLAVAEESGDRDAEKLPEKVEEGGFEGGDDVDGGAEVEGLRTAAS